MTLLIKIAAVLALLAALWAGEQYIEGIGAAKQLAVDQQAADQLKADAARVLASETKKADAATQALQDFKTNQEKIDADSEIHIAGLADRLRRLAAPARPGGPERLRDPHASTGGCGPGSSGPAAPVAAAAADRAADAAQAPGLLSAELTELLRGQAREADAINLAYAACRADGQALRAAPP